MFLSDTGVFATEGYACFDTRGTRLLEEIDRRIVALFAGAELQAWSIPAMITRDVLDRCGYFSSFPDQLLAVAAFDRPDLQRIADTGTADGVPVAPVGAYLTPAACLHVYPMLGSRPPGTNTTITLRARVYRREPEREAPLVRLSDFTVRELVFAGDRDHVRAGLDRAREAALALARESGLEARIAAGNDPFFPSRLNEAKVRMQRGNRRKHELVVPVGGRDVALASFNDHDLHFSEAFGFSDGRRVVTGCAGFGLERWVAEQLGRGEVA